MLPLEVLQLTIELVVLLVGDDGPVEDVVVVRRLFDALAQVPGARGKLAQRISRGAVGRFGL
jgi:hypothetical protein